MHHKVACVSTVQDSRVRYYACEALYNVAKVAREGFITFFNDVFDALFRLCADSEPNVQNAAQFLDNLVKVPLIFPMEWPTPSQSRKTI